MKPTTEERRKEIRRMTDCPADKCSALNGVAKQVKVMGATFIGVIGLIATVLILLTNTAMSSAEATQTETRAFIETHTTAMIANAALESKLVEQIAQQQRQMQKTTEIQQELVKKMARLEMLEDIFLGDKQE